VKDGQSVSLGEVEIEGGTTLDSLALEGARRMIATILEAEVEAFLERHAAMRDRQGRRVVVRNGHLPERVVTTGAGGVAVKAPRVRDLRGADHEEAVAFTSAILPKYLRKSNKIDELIPWLYLRGVSTNDMRAALECLVGPDAKGFSPGVVTRLATASEQEHEEWSRRDLSKAEYVYIWADGIHFNLRIAGNADMERQCMLVLMGATPDGKKELVAIQDGIREDEQSWKEMLLDLKKRGLKLAPKLAVGDGALGFWAALEKVFPGTRIQRCWVHKTANVLAKTSRRPVGGRSRTCPLLPSRPRDSTALQQLLDREPDVAGNLAKQGRRDVATRVERNGRSSSIRMPVLAMRSPLTNFLEA
jgi:transposase-like protein